VATHPVSIAAAPVALRGVLDAVHHPEAEGRSRLLNAYYAVKPVMPRTAQLALRRRYARRRVTWGFPSWPIEPMMVERLHARLAATLAETGSQRAPFVNLWPDRKRFAVTLTHDVEGPLGVANVERVRAVERRHGLVSSWNFVGEDYDIPAGLFESLCAEGCEIGLHGITHDGTLFRSRADFERQLPRIQRCLREWDAVGFRSPATHRNAAWMPELGCEYDSSFPDTDPFEPQPGGCCSIYPFFLGDMVELPLTMPQDHTLFDILGERSIRIWRRKAEWIARHHGLVCVLVHPDYVLTEDRLDLYDELLASLSSRTDAWQALPRDAARWWRARAALEDGVADRHTNVGEFAARWTMAHARKDDGDAIVFDV
jgi:peptidoglycan/xylan/chitin deacetylase (PgdA/CDA1 family)